MPEKTDAPRGPARGDDNHLGGPLSLGCGEALPEGGLAVPDLVAWYAEADPARVAVESSGAALSYGELRDWSGRIAARLSDAGVCLGSRVGLLAEPSTAMVAAALGIMRAGAAYVPVDPAYPPPRISGMLADARLACVVVSSATAHLVPASDLPVVRVEDTVDGPIASAIPVSGQDAAYLIYTSGSTGEPKGVLVEHAQLAASTLARRRVYPGEPVFLLVSPLAFDSSVAGVWGTLTAGGRLVVATADEVRDPGRLIELVHRHKITRLLCVPHLYGALLDAADRAGADRLDSLETVIVAGDVLPEALVRRHFTGRARASLINEYGPTEATVWASYYRVPGPGPASLGGPIPGARLYILDESRAPVPRGQRGELYIGGAGVARGYFGRSQATAEAFLDDPFAGTPGARMYRTGDVVRWTAEGTLDFCGRRDHQVKIRGHRVELGAVETALRAIPGVRDAVVVPDNARTRLAGFVVADSGTVTESMRGELAARLPAVMVPVTIQVLDTLPVTVNGKVDRVTLEARATWPPSAPVGSAVAAASDGTADDDVTAGVAAAWAEVLQVSGIPANVNFFDLGGNSLSVFSLQDALESRTGTRPSVLELFQHTTVAAQAALIRGSASTGEPSGATLGRTARRARRQRMGLEGR
jgi:amino acid adenylation domain-containing protein